MAESPEISHEAKMIIASNLAVAQAMIMSRHAIGLEPAIGSASLAAGMMIEAYAKVDGMWPQIEKQLEKAQANKPQ